MISVPPVPDLLTVSRAAVSHSVRYDDIAQDGRMTLASLAPALGSAVWSKIIAEDPAATSLFRAGIVPILTRFVAEGLPGPFSVHSAYAATGAFQAAHARIDGNVDKLIFNMWAEVTGPHAHTFGPRAPDGAPRAVAGRVFAEHVLTRLFAPAGDRKVTRLDLPGLPEVPPDVVAWRAPAAILELPDGATPIEPDFSADPVAIAFGLCHTDSNQHVNSLIYPRLFEEAALRRFAALARSTAVLARFVEVGYRKPSFAGETLRLVLQAFTLGGRLGAVGAFVSEAEVTLSPAAAKPRCCVKMLFEA